ncbi:MAG: hypothetical protein HY825_08635 [Acidobacteria bacterium]|nr:hypothetical protein [Acidobacteriota bacterium]
MTFSGPLADGFRLARRHPRLVLVAYLVPLLPALALVWLARASLAPALDPSPFAARVLDGRWIAVWTDFAASPANHLPVVLGAGVALALLLTGLLRVPVAAGIVEVLLEREEDQPRPFSTGVVLHTWPFLRAALWFALAVAVVAGASIATLVAFFKVAETQANGRFDAAGFLAAGLVAFLLLAVLVPAYDLARLAAARHGDRATLRGFLRGIGLVLRRPAIFLPLCASFVALVAALHLGYYAARSPWTPGSAPAILALLVAQQLVMVMRAFLHVSFWGAELAAYRHLGEPRLCERRVKAPAVVIETIAPEPSAPPAESEPAPAVPPLEPPPRVTDDVFQTS